MSAMVFIDTNVLVYAGSKAPEDQHKRATARALLVKPNIGFSAQVLQEFYSSAVNKKSLLMTHEEASAVLQSLQSFPVCPVTRDLVLDAIEIKKRFQISYWDAAIIAAAKQMGCHTNYSEDLNAGQDYDGVTVINPFAALTRQ